MTNQAPEQSPGEGIPEAVVTARSGISIVWLIPIVAALIGAWVAYSAFSDVGPTITITFETAEGLVAGKTKVKYKDVDVGLVQDVELGEDLKTVNVTAQMHKGAKKYLTETTRFWVVRARITAGSVSGLDTLLAGAYLGMDPVNGGEFVNEYKGLEKQPVVTTDRPGKNFLLKARRLGSLSVGAPIYFRQIRVGEVVSYELADDNQSIDFKVFINEPHHLQVTENTRFWNASGLDVSLTAAGINVEMESAISLLVGGIAFEVPDHEQPGEAVDENSVFTLFGSHKLALEKITTIKERSLLYFDGSVRGLSKGAPVEFRGIEIGQVIDIDARYDSKTGKFVIPVLIEIEPEKLGDRLKEVPTLEERLSQLEKLTELGLRAQLKTGNLLTGQLYVDLDFYPDLPRQDVTLSGKYPQILTIPTSLDEITRGVKALLVKLDRFPIDQLGNDLTKSLASLNKAIKQAEGTLKTVDRMFAPNAPLPQELQQALQELTAATRSLRVLADYLERHPEALLKGKE
jgi:paraquat-inducible protein B